MMDKKTVLNWDVFWELFLADQDDAPKVEYVERDVAYHDADNKPKSMLKSPNNKKVNLYPIFKNAADI